MRLPAALLVAAANLVPAAHADDVSLRLGGKDIVLSQALSARLAALTRETFSRCGPNTRQHAGNFGGSATLAQVRRDRALEGSRLHVVYDTPIVTISHLGGELKVTEATLGLEREGLFVGPAFTRDARGSIEHLQCEYLPELEIACLPELAPDLPARYAKTCALFERGADGKIVMPPPDVAPSCS